MNIAARGLATGCQSEKGKRRLVLFSGRVPSVSPASPAWEQDAIAAQDGTGVQAWTPCVLAERDAMLEPDERLEQGVTQ